MGYLELPRQADGTPKKGHENAVRAHQTVTAWLGEVEAELGLPSVGETRWHREMTASQAKLGFCPHCLMHDGYLSFGGEYWAVCHEHETRWKVDEDLITDAFRPSIGGTAWDDAENPHRDYLIVEPSYLRDEILEGKPISLMKDIIRLLFGKRG